MTSMVASRHVWLGTQEQQESRTLECEGIISRLHQQLAGAQEAQVSPGTCFLACS